MISVGRADAKPLSRWVLVRLKGFEPPTLGSVGPFHSRQLGVFPANTPRFVGEDALMRKGVLRDKYSDKHPSDSTERRLRTETT